MRRKLDSTREYAPELLGMMLFAAHLPLVLAHFGNLWTNRPHYQFFPMVLFAVFILLLQRWPQTRQPLECSEFRMGVFLTLSGIGALTAAVLVFSATLAMLALILTGAGVLQFATTRDFRDQILPAWLLLLILVPPPWRLDFDLILWLQSATATASSSLLYSFEVPHVLSGNVFRLPQTELFVAEACSGINGQLSLLVCSLVIGVMLQRTLVHCVLLGAASLFWSFVANVIRVSTVVAVEVQSGFSISDGWPHELLGYSLLVGGLLVVLLSDQLLLGLLFPISDAQRWDIAPVVFLRKNSLPYRWETLLLRMWNRLFADCRVVMTRSRGSLADDPLLSALTPPMLAGAVPSDHVVTNRIGPLKGATGQTVGSPSKAIDEAATSSNDSPDLAWNEQHPEVPSRAVLTELARAEHSEWVPRWSALIACCLLASALLGGIQAAVICNQIRRPTISAERLLSSVSSNWVDETVAGWMVDEYKEIERETSSDSGQYSRTWKLTRDDDSALWSLDFPFTGWHELSRCYTGQGWTIEDRRVLQHEDLNYVEVRLSHGTNWQAVLYFALTDHLGRSIAPRSTHWRGWQSRLKTSPTLQLFSKSESIDLSESLSIQMQLFSQSRSTFTEAELARKQRLFLDLVDRTRQRMRTGTSPENVVRLEQKVTSLQRAIARGGSH